MDLTLEVDESLNEKLADRAARKGFESTEEYCTIILETVITELEEEERTEAVERHLEDLGYL